MAKQKPKEDFSQIEKVLLSCEKLRKIFYLEELVVQCYLDFPEDFKMRLFDYPNNHKVLSILSLSKKRGGPVKTGYIHRGDVTSYLTEAGRLYIKQLKIEKANGLKIRLNRDETLLLDLLKSEAYRIFTSSNINSLKVAHAKDYWGGSITDRGDILIDRIKAFTKKLIQFQMLEKEFVLPGYLLGQEEDFRVTPGIIRVLNHLHNHLLDKFSAIIGIQSH